MSTTNKPFPGLPGTYDEQKQRASNVKFPFGHHRRLLTIVLVLTGLFVAWHVVPAIVVRDNPPVACQFDGGTWNIWDGWTC